MTNTKAKAMLYEIAEIMVKQGFISRNFARNIGIFCLAQRIYDLKEAGFAVIAESKNGDYFYHLIKIPPDWQKLLADFKLVVKSKRPKLRALNNI